MIGFGYFQITKVRAGNVKNNTKVAVALPEANTDIRDEWDGIGSKSKENKHLHSRQSSI